jgi:hypothetical protein
MAKIASNWAMRAASAAEISSGLLVECQILLDLSVRVQPMTAIEGALYEALMDTTRECVRLRYNPPTRFR